MSRLRTTPPVELWCIDLAAVAPALHAIEQHTPRLSAIDRTRASSFSDDTVRTEWMATHIALRLLIERWAGPQWRGVPYGMAAYGKPHLQDAPLSFSISHARGVALIGLSHAGNIGVDIERRRTVRIAAPRRDRIEVAGAALSETALPSEGEGRFLQAWVRLEACAKAEGCGIGRVLTRLGVIGSGAADLSGGRGATRPGETTWRDAETSKAGAPAAAFPKQFTAESFEVRDLQLGEGVFAAVAVPEGAFVGDIAWMPPDSEALERLID